MRQAMRGAGGSRTRFCGFADRRLAVRLRRPGRIGPPSEGHVLARNRTWSSDLRKVVCASVTLRGQRSEQERCESPTRESNPASRLRRPPCVRHTRGEAAQCPCQESNLVFDLRRVACRPSHAKGVIEADGRTRTGMILLTRQAPGRSATSATAGRKDLNPVREFWRLAALPGAHPCRCPRHLVDAGPIVHQAWSRAGSCARNRAQLSTRTPCAA